MAHGEEYAHTLVINVNGTTLSEDLTQLVTSAYVDDSVHVPSLFVIRFSDPHDLVLSRSGLAIDADVSIAVQTSRPGPPEEIFRGAVTAIEREIDHAGSHTVVRGLDGRHRLQGGARVAAYLNQKVSDVVRTVAQRAGVGVEVDDLGQVHDHIAQDGVNDWDFICQLAAGVGAELSMRGNVLRLRRPTSAATAPSSGTSATVPEVIQAGANLLSLRATLTKSDQVAAVTTRGWDPATKKSVVSQASATTTSAQLAGTSPARLATAGEHDVHPAQPSKVPAVLADRARSIAEARAGGFAELDGTVRGTPALRAGTAVLLSGVGAGFDGKYVLSAVRHDFAPHAGYLTDFTVAAASERSSYGVVVGAQPATTAPRGVLTGIVTNLNDPDKQGRVKVSFPALDDTYESWWARVVHPGAGADRGTVVLPEVNDEVLVAFTGNGLETPYVLGGLYNGQDKPDRGWDEHVDGSGQVTRRAFTSRLGMRVEMIESAAQEALVISTNNGEQHITLTHKQPRGIAIATSGPITITAGDTVEVTSDRDLKLAAMNIAIEATNALDLSGTKVTVAGQAEAAVQAPNVKVSGDAAAELSSGAITTVRGAMVKIN